MTVPNISIIIVSWNVKNYLRECIISIYKASGGVSLEVIVVDNASTDYSAEMIIREFPKVRLVRDDRNLGFSRANNQAIKLSHGKYILFLNPDTVIIDKSIDMLHSFIENHNEVIVVGPMILNADGKTIQYQCARTFPTLWREFCGLSEISIHLKNIPSFSYINLDYWDHKDSKYIDLISGACMMCRKEIVEKINLFDEDYFLYADDVDFCFRMREHGLIYYLAEAKIIHYGGQSSRQSDDDLWLLRCDSTRIFFKKHKGLHYSLGYRAVVILSQVIRFILILISNIRKAKFPPKESIMQIWKLIQWGLHFK